MADDPQKFKVILNGQELQSVDYSGTKDSKIIIRQKDKEGLVFSYSNNVRLIGEGRQIINDNILNSVNPWTSSVSLELRDNCCNDANGDPFSMFIGTITAQDIKWCEKTPEDSNGCTSMEVTAQDNSIEAQGIKCLKNTPIVLTESLDGTITSNGEDEARSAPFYKYCIETRPEVMQILRLAFIILNVVFFFPVLIIIGIIAVIFSFGAVSPADFIQFNNTYVLGIVGCGRKHKAPFVYSYLKNVCKLCGLNLVSTLFDVGGPYHNLTHLNAPFEKGGKTTAKAETAFKELNFPSDTGTQFLDTFKNLNIDYGVEGTNLVVERKDYFTNNIWIDFNNREDDIISQCYEFGSDGPKAGRVYEYQKDAGDIGEEANRLWGGKVVNYNIPFNPVLIGVDRVIIPFSPARFMKDTFGSVIGTTPIPGVTKPKNVLLLSRGTLTAPKLLMYDTGSDLEDARVHKTQNPGSNRFLYSIDSWLRNDIGQVIAGQENFYTRLLYIDDPREASNPSVNRKYQNYDLLFKYNCEDLRTFKVGSRIRLVQDGVTVTGTIDTLEIDYQLRQMRINGTI